MEEQHLLLHVLQKLLCAACASTQVLCRSTVDVLRTLLLLLLFMRFEWIKRINVVGSYKNVHWD